LSVSSLAYFSTLKLETVLFSETSKNFYQTTARHAPVDTVFEMKFVCENIKAHTRSVTKYLFCQAQVQDIFGALLLYNASSSVRKSTLLHVQPSF
jgi:hypothetical protein